jgi:hypothetical protein
MRSACPTADEIIAPPVASSFARPINSTGVRVLDDDTILVY